jgi:hypothetical protein
MSLGKIYYGPEHAAGFGFVSKLFKASKNDRNDAEEWFIRFIFKGLNIIDVFSRYACSVPLTL